MGRRDGIQLSHLLKSGSDTSWLKEAGLKVVTKEGNEMEELRKKFGLKELKCKSNPVFETHCVDSWALAASKTGAERPTTKSPYYLVPLRWHKRHLQRLEPEKGGIRRRYAGVYPSKNGTLVKHIRYGLCYIG